MKTFPMFFVLLLCIGCETYEKAAGRRAQSEQNIEQARLRVLQELPNLDTASREMIRTNRPSIPYVGSAFGGHSWFSWTISTNRFVELYWFTAPEGISNAPVK